MVTKTQQEFEVALTGLEESFTQGGRPDETNTQIAKAIVTFILKRERRRRGVSDRGRSARIVDSETIAKMQSWDSNDPLMSTLEKVFRRLTSGRGDDAIALLKASITAKAEAVSREQARRGSTQRKLDPFNQIIYDELNRRWPEWLSEPEFMKILRAMAGRSIVSRVSPVVIELDDPDTGYSEDIPVSGVRRRLTDMRKRVAAEKSREPARVN
jgi:hypothetical protein